MCRNRGPAECLSVRHPCINLKRGCPRACRVEPYALTGSSPSAALAPLVGKWRLDRTCAAIVRAVIDAELPQLIPMVIDELVTSVASGTDPEDACAAARRPTKHSRTFWPDGRFNSYDEAENPVDNGQWVFVDEHTLEIGFAPAAREASNGRRRDRRDEVEAAADPGGSATVPIEPGGD